MSEPLTIAQSIFRTESKAAVKGNAPTSGSLRKFLTDYGYTNIISVGNPKL